MYLCCVVLSKKRCWLALHFMCLETGNLYMVITWIQQQPLIISICCFNTQGQNYYWVVNSEAIKLKNLLVANRLQQLKISRTGQRQLSMQLNSPRFLLRSEHFGCLIQEDVFLVHYITSNLWCSLLCFTHDRLNRSLPVCHGCVSCIVPVHTQSHAVYSGFPLICIWGRGRE